MRYNTIGSTDLRVSELCLGSMTWGTQNSTTEAFTQIDTALDHGVNIIDTAEMYPVNPLTKETQGNSERIIGDWVQKSGRRNDVLIATKVSGSGYRNVRGGAPISPATIQQAVEASLTSLKTDVIDIYQLHWPNRGSYMFRQNWTFDPREQTGGKAELHTHITEVLECLSDLIKAGKIRHFGLSNESAWGLSQWLRLAEQSDLPRIATIQNEYSLLCRLFDLDLNEACVHEGVGLLAFSPLATGLLSGKYQPDVTPEGSRRTFGNTLGGRVTPTMWPALDAYLGVARKHCLDPCQMALAWCRTRPFMASAIFGSTTQAQLITALTSTEVELDQTVLDDIHEVYRQNPMPY